MVCLEGHDVLIFEWAGEIRDYPTYTNIQQTFSIEYNSGIQYFMLIAVSVFNTFFEAISSRAKQRTIFANSGSGIQYFSKVLIKALYIT